MERRMKMENKKIKLAVANAIVEQLWVKGLITEDEKVRIQARNKEKIN